MSRLGDVGLVHHFKQVLNSYLRESIYQLCPMPRTWVEWKREASILDNQWRRFNATHPQALTSQHSAATPMYSITPTSPYLSANHAPPMLPYPTCESRMHLQPSN